MALVKMVWVDFAWQPALVERLLVSLLFNHEVKKTARENGKKKRKILRFNIVYTYNIKYSLARS